MKKGNHVHTPDDGRGHRLVFLNGELLERVIYADTRRGFVRVVGDPVKLDKFRKRVLWKTLRGKVEVVSKRQSTPSLEKIGQ